MLIPRRVLVFTLLTPDIKFCQSCHFLIGFAGKSHIEFATVFRSIALTNKNQRQRFGLRRKLGLEYMYILK